MTQSIDQILARKLLAIDGDGMRASIALQILKRIETILREHPQNPADYFDYVAGSDLLSIEFLCPTPF